MVTSWYLEHGGHIVIMEKTLEMTISTELSYHIIKKIFKSARLSKEDQDAVIATVLPGNLTDSAMRILNECKASIPHPNIKQILWSTLTNPEKAMSLTLYDYHTYCKAFLQAQIPYHLALSLPLAQDFYHLVPHMVLKMDRDRFEYFLAYACPAI